MVKKIIIPLVVFVMSLLSWNDESPTGPKPIDPDKIQGTWQVVKMIETCESESDEVDYLKMFLVIDANQIAFWSYEFSDCVDSETIPTHFLVTVWAVNISKVKKYWWWINGDSLAFDGDNLVITILKLWAIWREWNYGLVMVFQRYNGVPQLTGLKRSVTGLQKSYQEWQSFKLVLWKK